MLQKYKYDVAFSFLKDDENLATRINDLLSERLTTFLYSKNQDEVAGTDGEKTFNEVFGKESRIVVVLYRPGWGNTAWTRIEETAIRNRAYEDGYDFCILIPLTKPPNIPEYFPKTQLWVGLDKWGIEGAASVIESRVQSAGGSIKTTTPEDIARRIKQAQEFEITRGKILNSADGLELARQEVNNLFEALNQIKINLETGIDGFSVGYNRKDNSLSVIYGEFVIRFLWQPAYQNSLMDSSLYFALQQPVRSYSENPKVLLERRYHFDINNLNQHGWIIDADRKSFKSSEKLADDSVKFLLMAADKEWKDKLSGKYL